MEINENTDIMVDTDINVNKDIEVDTDIKVNKDIKVNIKLMSFKEKIDYFGTFPNYPQKSKEWLKQRNSYLTASTIHNALGLCGKVANFNLLKEKVTYISSFNGNIATQWGNKYEYVANRIYSKLNNDFQIYEFGLIPSEQYPILAVSPDGITETGKLIEIKCPYSRVIDNKIKPEYYSQMQEQLVVCDFDECDFIECKINEFGIEEFKNNIQINKEKMFPDFKYGIVISYLNVNTNSDILYKYSAINDEKLFEWEQNTINEIENNVDLFYIQSSYYECTIFSIKMVKRDVEWINKNYPILEQFWNKVLECRDVGIIEPESPKISPTINDVINNFICLI